MNSEYDMVSKDDIARAAIEESIACLHYGMEKIEHCIAQLDDGQCWWRPDERMNAVGNLLLHLDGNLGQWIVAGIGDREDTRDRPREFSERRQFPKSETLSRLRETVDESCATLLALPCDDLMTKRTIQGTELTKMQAMLQSVTHFQGHVQEIISLTRQQLRENYQFQWTPDDET